METKARMKDELIKGMAVEPLGELIETLMSYLPKRTMDLAEGTEDRAKMRLWLDRIADSVTRHNVQQFTEATRRAIDSAGKLVCDPQFFEKRKEARRKREPARRQRAVERERRDKEDRESWARARALTNAAPPKVGRK